MTIPTGSTFYSKHASIGDLIYIDGLNDLVADMIEIMSNLNMLEAWAGYPLTTWSDPYGSYSEFLTLRAVIAGLDIPGSGLYITDAINRVRVQVLGLSAISSWGFNPSDVTRHITARDNMQAWLGSPIERVPTGDTSMIIETSENGTYISEFLTGTTVYFNDLSWAAGIPTARWKTVWPLFFVADPVDAGAASYFGFNRTRQFIFAEWTEDSAPDLSPETVEVRTVTQADLLGGAIAAYAASTSTGTTYAASPFVAVQATDITANITAWLSGGLPGTDLVVFYSTSPFPHVEANPGPPELYYRNWSLPAFEPPGTVADAPVFFWGVDE